MEATVNTKYITVLRMSHEGMIALRSALNLVLSRDDGKAYDIAVPEDTKIIAKEVAV